MVTTYPNEITVQSLVEAELAAADACASALSRFQGLPSAKELRRIQQEHREAANELRRHEELERLAGVRTSGRLRGIASRVAGLLARLGTSGRAIQSVSKAEEKCFRLYKDAVFEESVPVECQALVWSTLLPRMQSHREALNRLRVEK